MTGLAHAGCEGQRADAGPPGPGADLSCADLRRADLTGLDLTGADLSGARLDEADLSGTNLTNAVLTDAHAEGTLFVGADLTGTDLRGTVMRFADLRDATLDGAEFCTTDLTATRNIGSVASSVGTRFCRSTALPEEYEIAERMGWKYLPFHRIPRPSLVTFRSFEGLGVFLYNDQGSDESDTLDLFDDGGASVAATFASLDFVPPWTDFSHRHWLSGAGLTAGAGFGATTDSEGAVTVITLSAGVYVEPLSFLVVEAGATWGVTPDSRYAGVPRTDVATYVGMRLEAAPLVAFADDLARIIVR